MDRIEITREMLRQAWDEAASGFRAVKFSILEEKIFGLPKPREWSVRLFRPKNRSIETAIVTPGYECDSLRGEAIEFVRVREVIDGKD